jgi:hypothetical protein
MRGGARDPLSQAELEAKFVDNCLHGGWDRPRAEAARLALASLFAAPDMAALAGLRA